MTYQAAEFLSTSDPLGVVVIGGRATGTAAMAHLVDTVPPGSTITVVDPADSDHPAVFDDPDSLLLVNTSADLNSLYPGKPDDFQEFLGGYPQQDGIPRFLVGQYYQSVYRLACLRAANRDVAVRRSTDLCRSVTVRSDGYDVFLVGGREPIYATDVVIAVGVGKPRPVLGITGIAPYPSRLLRQSAGRSALVVGSGLSAVDAAMVLCAAGSRVVMASRSGHLPAVRMRTPGTPVDIGPVSTPADIYQMVEQVCRDNGQLPLARQFSSAVAPVDRLREEIRLAEEDLCPWQNCIIGILDVVNQAVVPVARTNFVWRYATAMLLPVARRLLARLEAGEVILQDLNSVNVDEHDLVVTATGFLPPAMYSDGNALYLKDQPPFAVSAPDLRTDLRLVLSPERGPERIWAIGPASASRVPFANFLHAATIQARYTAEQIGGSAVRTQLASVDELETAGVAQGVADW
jgi:hypothetical protein